TIERAMLENITVIRRRVANLRVIGIAPQRFGVAILEKARAGSPEKIDVSFDVAIGDVSLAVDLQRILEAVEIQVAKDGAGIGAAVQNDRLGLRASLRRGVVEREIFDR